MRPSIQVAEWALAVVLCFAGAQKLRRPKRAALALVDFRLARTVRESLGRAAGSIELTVAFLLIVPQTAKAGAVSAALLFWFFATLLVRATADDADFSCFCFGGESEPISYVTASRTAALAAISTVVATALWLDPDLGTTSGRAYASAAIAGVSLVGVCFLVARLPTLFRLNRDFMRYGGVH